MSLVERTSVSDNTEVLVDERDFQDVDNDLMVKIINDVETRLIQEEIQQNCVDNDKLRKERHDNRFKGILPAVGGAVLTVAAAVPLSSNFDLNPLIFISIAMVPFVAGLFPGLSGAIKDSKRVDRINAIVKNWGVLRKNLLEQSLKIQVVSGEDSLGRNWSEVSGIKGDKAVKYLVRIVDDEETGFEKIEVKEF